MNYEPGFSSSFLFGNIYLFPSTMPEVEWYIAIFFTFPPQHSLGHYIGNFSRRGWGEINAALLQSPEVIFSVGYFIIIYAHDFRIWLLAQIYEKCLPRKCNFVEIQGALKLKINFVICGYFRNRWWNRQHLRFA